MTDVAVNDNALQTAVTLSNHIETFRSHVDTLKRTGDNLKGNWKGRHSDQFHQVWGEAYTALNKAHEQMAEVHRSINTIMNNIKSAGDGGH